MGKDLYDGIEEVKKLIYMVDEVLGFSFLNIIFEGF